MKEGYFKMSPEGEIYQTYHIINFEGETDGYGSTFEQASALANEYNISEGSCNWQVVIDSII